MKLISFISIVVFSTVDAQSFSVARVHYGGGGDWYSDPSSIPNLLTYLDENTPVSTSNEDIHIKLTDKEINQYPYLYITGHGNIRLTEDEVISLRSILMNNGFLHADDNYGLDASFRRELKRVFPNKELVPLPNEPISFPNQFLAFPNEIIFFPNQFLSFPNEFPNQLFSFPNQLSSLPLQMNCFSVQID